MNSCCRRRMLLFYAICVALCWLESPGLFAEDNPHRRIVRGRVTLADAPGSPVSGLRILIADISLSSADDTPRYSATSDTAGEFTLVIEQSEHDSTRRQARSCLAVCIDSPEYVLARPVLLSTDDAGPLVLEAYKAPQIQGHVVDKETGLPIEDADILGVFRFPEGDDPAQVSADALCTVRTSSGHNGGFVLSPRGLGDFVVLITKETYAFVPLVYALSADSSTLDIVASLDRGRTIQGVLRPPDEARQRRGLTVQVVRKDWEREFASVPEVAALLRTAYDPDALSFCSSGIAPGEYEIQVVDASHIVASPWRMSCSVKATDRTLDLGVLTLPAGLVLRGQVLLPAEPSANEHWLVQVRPMPPNAQSPVLYSDIESDGSYCVTGLSPGAYRVLVQNRETRAGRGLQTIDVGTRDSVIRCNLDATK